MGRLFTGAGLLILLLTASCSKFEFDPNQAVDLNSGEQLNYHYQNQLAEQDSVITIALTGDSHIDYGNTEKVVEAINKVPEVDFTIHTGDLTDNGILQQYKWTEQRLRKLNKPYFAVVGNHDVVGKGERVYREMYGKTNFSIIYGGIKFIFFNSNSREYGFKDKVPDLDWVTAEMQHDGTFDRIILVSHVPYFNYDFDQSYKAPYLKMLKDHAEKKNIMASFNGHMHDPSVERTSGSGVLHICPGSVNRHRFMVVTIRGNELTYEQKSF